MDPHAVTRIGADIERDARSALPPGSRAGQVVDTVGRAIGRAAGYLQTHSTSAMRADAEVAIAARPLVALAAALGVGYVVGREMRR